MCANREADKARTFILHYYNIYYLCAYRRGASEFSLGPPCTKSGVHGQIHGRSEHAGYRHQCRNPFTYRTFIYAHAYTYYALGDDIRLKPKDDEGLIELARARIYSGPKSFGLHSHPHPPVDTRLYAYKYNYVKLHKYMPYYAQRCSRGDCTGYTPPRRIFAPICES